MLLIFEDNTDKFREMNIKRNLFYPIYKKYYINKEKKGGFPTMKIVMYPDPILEQKATPIENIADYRDILLEMKAFVENPENKALGIALPQVGISKRAFVANIDDKVEVIINPQIVKSSKAGICLTKGEGCLSIPDASGIVYRSKKIKVEYTTLEGEIKKSTLQDLDAIVFGHEEDHLNGILFTSKVQKEAV